MLSGGAGVAAFVALANGLFTFVIFALDTYILVTYLEPVVLIFANFGFTVMLIVLRQRQGAENATRH